MKRSVIISNKHDIYKLPRELRFLMTKDLRKLGSVRKISKLYRIIAQHLVFKVLSILAKKSGKIDIELPRSAFFKNILSVIVD